MKENKTSSDTTGNTILAISVGFVILFLILSWRWTLYVSVIVGLASLLSSFLSRKIEWVWNKFTFYLGYIISNLVLTLVFYLVLCPVAFLSRIFNKDQLMLLGNHRSYFIDVNRVTDKKSFERTW